MEPRYDTPEMTQVWSSQHRDTIERQLWLAVMGAQREQGMAIPESAIASSQAAIEQLDERGDAVNELYVNELEQQYGHDLYARLQYFNWASGHDYAHRGLTSADITENAQQVQIVDACEVLGTHGVSLAVRLRRATELLQDSPMVARTHGRPAQLTTIGKRHADWLDALMEALHALEVASEHYSPRGIKGAVGTNADLADLLGSASDAAEIDLLVSLEITADIPALVSTGQCYPRGIDLPLLAAALQVVSVCEKITIDVRLMVALGHVSEQPRQRQVGSSAMPHKLNPRYSERVASLAAAAWGYFAMLTRHQPWLEGDVSTSAVRRIALSGLFQAVDAALANTAYVLDSLTWHAQAVQADIQRWSGLLASGRLMSLVLAKTDLTRDQVHAILRELADIAMQDSEPSPVFLSLVALRPEFGPGVADGLYEAVADHRENAVAAAAAAAARLLAVVDLPQDEHPQWPGDLL